MGFILPSRFLQLTIITIVLYIVQLGNSNPTPQQPQATAFNPQPPPPMRGPTAPLYPVQTAAQQMAPPAGSAFTDPNPAFTNVNPQLQSGPANPAALPASTNPFAGMPPVIPKKASSLKDYYLNMQANAKANGASSNQNKPSSDPAASYNNDLKNLMNSPE